MGHKRKTVYLDEHNARTIWHYIIFLQGDETTCASPTLLIRIRRHSFPLHKTSNRISRRRTFCYCWSQDPRLHDALKLFSTCVFKNLIFACNANVRRCLQYMFPRTTRSNCHRGCRKLPRRSHRGLLQWCCVASRCQTDRRFTMLGEGLLQRLNEILFLLRRHPRRPHLWGWHRWR